MEKTVVELFAGVGGFRVGLNNIKELSNDGRAIENVKTISIVLILSDKKNVVPLQSEKKNIYYTIDGCPHCGIDGNPCKGGSRQSAISGRACRLCYLYWTAHMPTVARGLQPLWTHRHTLCEQGPEHRRGCELWHVFL